MNRRYYKNKRTVNLKKGIVSYIENNLREYIIISIIFLIGIVIGVIFINNASENQITQIKDYILSFINSIKENKQINDLALLKQSIKSNLLFTIILWFMGSTVIGISIVYLIIGFRGFCLGYTISSIILSCGTWKGLLFLVSTLMLQNIFFVPCIISLAVSGMKLHNSIIKNKRRENIKLEILRHTIFSFVMLIFLILSSFIEVYISKNILLSIIKYF